MSKALLIKSYTDITTGTQGQWNELTMALEGTKRSVYLRERPKMMEEPRIEMVR